MARAETAKPVLDTTEDYTVETKWLPVSVLDGLASIKPQGPDEWAPRRFEFVTVTLANLGRAIPSFAILSMALIVSLNVGLGLGFWPTFAALFFLPGRRLP